MTDVPRTSEELHLLKQKYLEERDKRLRPEGLGQYREVDLAGAEYGDDPYAPPIERAAIEREVDVLMIGGGHAGLLVADALIKGRVDDFLIVEKAGGFGGTWYWNRYPDCRCDIEAYIYMPLVDEDGVMPSQKYVRSSEIRANAARIGAKLGLGDKTLFQTGVSSARWDEAAMRWVIGTDRGDTIRARFVCLGSGPMSRPKLPDIAGIERFKGRTFHTSRWDYSYTGGDETGNLTGLADKRVALIGTGASGVQVIPRLAESAGHFYVVQRTPAAVDDRYNQVTQVDWWNSLKPGWWEERAANFAGISVGEAPGFDLVADNWTALFAKFNSAAAAAAAAGVRKEVLSSSEAVDFAIMNAIRNKIDERVQDRATAEALKPWYNYFCKRPLFLDGYYETFNRPNVKLVDTQGRGLDAVTENAIVFDGKEHEVDCIIYASGFEVAVPLDRAGGFELFGRDGVRLSEHWQDGMVTLHGLFTDGFPNLCMIGGVRQASFSWNVSYILKRQAEHFTRVVKHCLASGSRGFTVRQQAEQEWLAELDRASAVDIMFLSECTPGYLNNEGSDVAGGLASQGYGRGVLAYARQLEEWREKAMGSDLELLG